VIAFRHADARYPFLWEGSGQPEGRWHAHGEGPAHYFADTPYGAWAEFLRHEEITDPADLATIQRQIWAVDLGDAGGVTVALPIKVTSGGRDTYRQCQEEARRLRARGAERLLAPSAALLEGGATGTVVQGGVHAASARDGRVIVVFGPAPDLVGWIVTDGGRPPDDLRARVRHFVQPI
jgi:hypothetical protein